MQVVFNQLFSTHCYCLIEMSSLDSNGCWYPSQQFLAAADVAESTRTNHATAVCLNITSAH